MTAKQMKRKRKEMGLSQSKLAVLLDCSIDTVKSWELGRNPISRIVELALKQVEMDHPKQQEATRG